jgi:hypothetical protein
LILTKPVRNFGTLKIKNKMKTKMKYQGGGATKKTKSAGRNSVPRPVQNAPKVTIGSSPSKGTSMYRKYDDGGGVTRKDIKDAKREAKLKRIQAGTEPSTYEKVANITGNVANTAASAAQVANAVRDTRAGMTGPGGMKKGGSVKKYKTGGMTNSNAKASVTKRATGKTGGISKAPKTAVPKAKYGMSMRKK